MDSVKRVVITGATGTIGTALIKECIRHNIEVLVLAHKSSKRNSVIPIDPLVSVCFCSLDKLKNFNLDTKERFDIFYHLAWQGTTGIERNDMYLQTNNIQTSLDAIALAKRLGCHTFIGAGSQAEYGRHNHPLKPNTPTFPETGYGYAKLCAGQMTRDYAHHLGIRHIWIRILSIYGPNDGKNSLISYALSKLMVGERIQTTKGEQYWDYLYSADAAVALRLIADKGIDGKVYVLGSGYAQPLSEYLNVIRDFIDPKLEIGIGELNYTLNQIMYLCADISDITKDTGWKPKTNFLTGISRCVQELKNNIIAFN